MKLRALICVVAIFAVQAAFAQHTNVANWRLMDKYSNAVLGRFVYSSTVSPQWINDSDRFWYEWRESAGKRFMFVDPKSHTKKPAFDHDHLAAALSELGKKPVVGNQLPFDAIEYDKDEKTITFTVEKQNYEWNLKDETLKEVKGDPVTAQSRFGGRFRGNFFGQGNNDRPTFDTAPDDLAFVYMQGYNLFVGKKEKKEDDADKVEAKQLTTDGVQFYEFRGVNYRTYTLGDKQETKTRVPVTWSEDSKAFIVERSDGRKIKDLWVINSLSDPRPTLETYKYAMPGEENVEQTELYYFTEDTGELKRIPAEKWKDQTLSDLHWC
ncbi:MAG TPA: DPP IV N-terminal domain-containing protein, partial [Fimbriimonadaceae bacterium]|nr:DPP IV N-terminal domain-containing protein [Fimbriimonadaceae bacterium]